MFKSISPQRIITIRVALTNPDDLVPTKSRETNSTGRIAHEVLTVTFIDLSQDSDKLV